MLVHSIKQWFWSVAFCLAFLFIGERSNSQISFQATTNASQVVENGVFTVEFKLQNAISNAFTPPDFKPFKVVGGPSTSQSTSIINGKRSQSMSLSYSLLATTLGKHTIGPATINVNGNRLQTKPIQVEVVKAAPGGESAGGPDIFLRAEIDSAQIYPGQQQFLYYKIYTQVNIRDYSSISEDQYEDFYFRYVKDFDRRPQQVVIDGKQYTSQIIKTVALFPQKTGVFSIDPFILNVWVPKPGANTSRSFFRTYNHINKQISSNPVIINVTSLPPGAPESFSGAVGKFNMQANIDKQKITTDDALVLRMRVVGDGDSRRWSAPEIGLNDQFEVFEPNIIYEKSIDQNGIVMSEKTFEYLMIPKKTGTIRFSAPFTFFSPDSMRFVTLNSRRFTVQVSQGTQALSDRIEELAAVNEGLNIEDFKTHGKLRMSQCSFFGSTLFWILAVLPFCLLGIAIFLERRKSDYLNMDPEKRKMLEANRKAMERLKEAETFQNEGSSKDYYDAISKAIFGYVSDKLKIPHSELSYSSINSKVDQLGLDNEKRERLMSILSKCQFLVYGGGAAGEARKELFDQTLQLITELEAELNV